MIGRLNHVAIAVPDLVAGTAVYASVLGAETSSPQELPEHGVKVVFVNLPNTKIELLEPLGEGSPIAAFLERNPAGGIHHICYEVDDIRSELARLKSLGHRLIDEEPRDGAENTLIAFIHPTSMGGVLTELCQFK